MRRQNGARPPAAALRRIDCVSTLLRRETSSGDEVLLVWNADWRTPGWSLPGGAREPGESLTETAAREMREETGLEIRVESLIDIHERIGLGGRIHLVVFTFAGEVIGGSLLTDGCGEPEPGGVSAARWVPIDEARRFKLVSRILEVSEPVIGARCSCDRPRIPSRTAARTQTA